MNSRIDSARRTNATKLLSATGRDIVVGNCSIVSVLCIKQIADARKKAEGFVNVVTDIKLGCSEARISTIDICIVFIAARILRSLRLCRKCYLGLWIQLISESDFQRQFRDARDLVTWMYSNGSGAVGSIGDRECRLVSGISPVEVDRVIQAAQPSIQADFHTPASGLTHVREKTSGQTALVK